jgi:carbonic anhydrase-like protein
MMNSFRFGTAINCIDGRTQQVVIDHMKQNYNIDGVDMVTFPGADGLFSNGDHSEEIALIRRAVSISIEKHGSRIIAVVGCQVKQKVSPTDLRFQRYLKCALAFSFR